MTRSEVRAMFTRHMDDVRRAFAEALAARFGRSVDEIREEGLTAGDFRTNEGIDLTLPDRSTMSFRYAFFVRDEALGAVGVFTEHCGYHGFDARDLEVREIRDGAVVAQHRW